MQLLTHPPPALRRGLLVSLVGSLAISALVAISFFIFSDFGEIEVKILLTTLAISFYSLTGLGSSAPLERGHWRAFSVAGLVLATLGFATFLPGIWVGWFEGEAYGKSMASMAIFSFSFAQASLLSLPRLGNRSRFMLPLTVLVIFALATLVTGMFVGEPEGEVYFRALGVLGVLDGFGMVAIPVISRLAPAQEESITCAARVQIRCPRCQTLQWLDMAGAICRRCSLHITVQTGP